MTRVGTTRDEGRGTEGRRRTGTWRGRPAGRGSGRRPLRSGALLALALLLFGCGGGGPEIPEGILVGDAVTPQLRQSVQEEAATFLTRAREGRWDAIWTDTAAQVRQQSTREQFLGSIQRVGRLVGFPPAMETLSLAVVHFGESYPAQDKVVYKPEDQDESLTLILTDHPVQASLVQWTPAGGERFYVSTLWFEEEGRWKLAAFFAKPATAFGRGWETYEEEAAAQRLAGNLRNAALLYNLAIDLVVPAAWIKPPEVERMERAQRRINVTQLPAGRLMAWPADPDTFQVFSARYNILPSGLGLLFGYESPVAVGDTLGQREYAERIMAHIRTEFPEYAELFSSVTLQAHDPTTHRPFWTGNFPLERQP